MVRATKLTDQFGKPVKVCHVVCVPLLANPRTASIIDQRLLVVGQLRNATLGSALARADAMRSAPAWKAARSLEGKVRAKAYRDLYKAYGVRENDIRSLAFGHWQASGWMGEVVDARTANAVGAEVAVSVKNWLLGHTARPGFSASREREVVWAANADRGLMLKAPDERRALGWRLVWGNQRTPRKALDNLPLDLRRVSRPRREFLAGAQVLKTGIKREVVRGRARYFALICIKGHPYRHPDYLRAVLDAEDVLGCDLGPSRVALVGEHRGATWWLCDPQHIEARKAGAARERRRRRAVARSRRANNPHAHRRNGRSMKGVRQPLRSKRARERQRALTDEQRRNTIHRKQDRSRLVKHIAMQAIAVGIEDHGVKGWMRSLRNIAKRMGLTAPGALVVQLAWELAVVGGELVKLPTRRLAASQRCVCGARRKKLLSERTHRCADCGLVCDRDLLSGLLLRDALINGWTHTTTTSSSSGNAPASAGQAAPSDAAREAKGRAEALCAPSPRAAFPVPHPWETNGHRATGETSAVVGSDGSESGSGPGAPRSPDPANPRARERSTAQTPRSRRSARRATAGPTSPQAGRARAGRRHVATSSRSPQLSPPG